MEPRGLDPRKAYSEYAKRPVVVDLEKPGTARDVPGLGLERGRLINSTKDPPIKQGSGQAQGMNPGCNHHGLGFSIIFEGISCDRRR